MRQKRQPRYPNKVRSEKKCKQPGRWWERRAHESDQRERCFRQLFLRSVSRRHEQRIALTNNRSQNSFHSGLFCSDSSHTWDSHVNLLRNVESQLRTKREPDCHALISSIWRKVHQSQGYEASRCSFISLLIPLVCLQNHNIGSTLSTMVAAENRETFSLTDTPTPAIS